MRINKFLAECGVGSRRNCDKIIEEGRVKINGKTVKPAHEVKVGDILELGFNSGTVKLKVLMIKETVKKEEAESMYEILGD